MNFSNSLTNPKLLYSRLDPLDSCLEVLRTQLSVMGNGVIRRLCKKKEQC